MTQFESQSEALVRQLEVIGDPEAAGVDLEAERSAAAGRSRRPRATWPENQGPDRRRAGRRTGRDLAEEAERDQGVPRGGEGRAWRADTAVAAAQRQADAETA
ncbi:hypothetical protein ACFQ9X_57185, partial [Catenulispora yoronensis]